jgi:hypothetical protein
VSEIRPISPNPIPGDQSYVARAAREAELREELERDHRAKQAHKPKRRWWRFWER